jgi:hypothetical protein
MQEQSQLIKNQSLVISFMSPTLPVAYTRVNVIFACGKIFIYLKTNLFLQDLRVVS